jgi:GT2 family glycosyltransferase
VAVIIVSWNVRHYLPDCLRSVLAELQRMRLKGAIWLIDNASTDGSAEFIADLFPTVHLVANTENTGFAAANNQGMKLALPHRPRYFLLLNPDTVVRPGGIGNMVGWMNEHAHVGMVGARLVYKSGELQHSAFQFPGLRQLMFEFWPLPARLYESRMNGRYPGRWYRNGQRPFRIDHPLGAAMLVRRDVAEVTHGFDEAYHMYCEEIDWSWRIRRAGWQIYTVPSAEIVHFGGESTKQIPARSIVNLWSSRARFYRRYARPWKLFFARRIARAGLQRRAAQATSADIREAYLTAAEAWL